VKRTSGLTPEQNLPNSCLIIENYLTRIKFCYVRLNDQILTPCEQKGEQHEVCEIGMMMV
jgi:hypothetical protein